MDPEQIPLRDIHLPEAVGWWPLAPGWWFLIALAVAGLCYLLYLQFLKWRGNRARRVALAELTRIQASYRGGAETLPVAIALSELLRRGMLAYAPRAEVAGLAGESWLGWLDRGLEDQPFTKGPGRSLEDLPYRHPDSVRDSDVGALFDVVRLRLRTPLPEAAG